MGNIAINLDEQIHKFKERGLNVSCYSEEKLKEILLDIGYYRLGYYGFYFFNETENKYVQHIKISDIINLYYLDIDLKYLLLRYINRIEINFRTKLIYRVSMKYQNNPAWYVDDGIIQIASVNKFKKEFYTEKFIMDNLTIRKHHEKYPNQNYAPCWKVFEYITFGSVITIFKNIKDESIKKEISNEYGVKKLDKFFQLLNAVRIMRNICAHSGVLFDYSMQKSIASIPQIKFKPGDNSSLDALIKVIGYFVKNISKNRYMDYENDIKEFFSKYNSDPILAKMIREKIKYID